jgi:hypothetical protein
VTGERDEDQVLGEMAQQASIDVSTVRNILNGDIQCPPMGRLEAFAEVLQTDVGDIVAAANQDGCEYAMNQKTFLQRIQQTITNALTSGGSMSKKTEREGLIDALVANERIDLSQDELQDEEKYSLCALKAMNAMAQDQDDSEDVDVDAIVAKTVEATKNAIFESDEIKALQALAKNQQSQEEAEKQQVITYLTKNQITGMSEEELKAQPLHTLKEFARVANGGMEINYLNNTGEKDTEEDLRPAKPKPVFINKRNRDWSEIDKERSES